MTAGPTSEPKALAQRNWDGCYCVKGPCQEHSAFVFGTWPRVSSKRFILSRMAFSQERAWFTKQWRFVLQGIKPRQYQVRYLLLQRYKYRFINWPFFQGMLGLDLTVGLFKASMASHTNFTLHQGLSMADDGLIIITRGFSCLASNYLIRESFGTVHG